MSTTSTSTMIKKPNASIGLDEHDFSSSSDSNLASDQAVTSYSEPFANLDGRTFTTRNGGFPWRDLTILDNDTPIYSADVSQYTPRTPDMVWHRKDKAGVVVGHTFMHWARSIKCGLGAEEMAMEWIEMKRGGWTGSKNYQFQWDDTTYVICRSNSGRKSGHYHVLNEAKEVVATHDAEFKLGMRRDKEIVFRAGVSEELQLLIIMGVCAWREKSRRKRNAANRQPY